MTRESGRYYITVVAECYGGYRNVPFDLFHNQTLSFEEYRQVLAPEVATDEEIRTGDLHNLAAAAEQTFSEQEVACIRSWFEQWPGASVKVVSAPVITHPDMIGPADRDVGSVLPFSRMAGWPFEGVFVHGWFDVIGCEQGDIDDEYEPKPEFVARPRCSCEACRKKREDAMIEPDCRLPF